MLYTFVVNLVCEERSYLGIDYFVIVRANHSFSSFKKKKKKEKKTKGKRTEKRNLLKPEKGDK